MLNYFYSITDENGYIHSIDNCILQYDLYSNGMQEVFIAFLHLLRDKYNLSGEYWERLNCVACSHWSWFLNHIHLCNGIYISCGKYNCLNINSEKMIVPVIKLEINLNKHYRKECYKELNHWLINNSGDITLLKYDYAVDLPCNIKDVEVFGSNKERGLYKGTRYYGQRNKNGYCKIYDKQKESDLEKPLTRIEHTIVPDNKKYKNLSLENIYIKSDKKNENTMNDTDRCIITMIKSLKAYGEDISKYTDMLGRRKAEKIISLLNDMEYKKVYYSTQIIEKLLKEVQKLTHFIERKKTVFEDEHGFLRINDDIKLPFD